MTPDRFFTLMLALRTRPHTTVPALAEEIGVSPRTVARDLQWLADAGFPVLTRRGRYGGVSLLPGSALDITRLTPDEREPLTVTGLDADQRRRLGVADSSDRAVRKLTGARATDDLLPLADVVISDNRPWFGREPEGVAPAEIITDLRRGVRLKITYQRAGEHARTRTVDPYGLLAKAGRWYLVADEQGRPRLFNLAHLTGWRSLRSRRRLRPGRTLATVAEELTSAWESDRLGTIDFLLANHQVARATRILGARLRLGAADGLGRVRASLHYRDLEDVRQLLAFGAAVTVLNPPEARRRLIELAREIISHYGEAHSQVFTDVHEGQ